MSSEQLIQALRSIGYPKVDNIDPHSLSWAFEKGSTLPFLEWFCDSIGDSNVLTDKELEEYKGLQDSGTVLSGTSLEDSLSTISVIEEQSETEQSDIEKLTRSLENLKSRKNKLRKRHNELSVQQMSIKNKLTKMEEVAEKENLSLTHAMEQTRNQNSKTAEVLHNITTSVDKLTALYSTPPPQSTRGADAQHSSQLFLSQADLKEYHAAEEKYSHDLTAFTRKQFFEGMADISGQRETTSYDLLNVSSAEESFGDVQDEPFAEDCQEFTRLQQIFPLSEFDRLNALVNACRAMSAVREAKSILHQIKSGHFPTSPADIIQLQHRGEERISAIQAETAPFISSLSALIRELGGLQGTEILTGNYDLKLKRQDYFMKKQEKVIEHLVNQRARSEFLIMLCGLEEKFHEETHHLLLAVLQTLQTDKSDWEKRMKDMDDPDLSSSRFDRSVVDIRDTSSARLYQLIGDQSEDKKLLQLSSQKVIERAQHLHSSSESSKTSNQRAKETLTVKISELETCVSERESLLYAGSSTSEGKPNLSPQDLQETFAKLTAQLSNLKDQLQVVMTDVQAKKKALKGNLLENKKRELFILFHTNPERLKYVVNSLANNDQQD